MTTEQASIFTLITGCIILIVWVFILESRNLQLKRGIDRLIVVAEKYETMFKELQDRRQDDI
jgi:hypothetical protein